MLQSVGEVTVDNPYEHDGAPPKIKTQRQLRGDRLALLQHRRQIGEAEYMAGREYQRLCEAAEVGSVGAMDPSKDPVDGGGAVPDVLTDRQLDALKRLAGIDAVLGDPGWRLARAVLIDGLTYPQVAQRYYSGATRPTVTYVGRRFRECLETLAKEFGYGG